MEEVRRPAACWRRSARPPGTMGRARVSFGPGFFFTLNGGGVDDGIFVTNLVYIGTLVVGGVLMLVVAFMGALAVLLAGLARLALWAVALGARIGSRILVRLTKAWGTRPKSHGHGGQGRGLSDGSAASALASPGRPGEWPKDTERAAPW